MVKRKDIVITMMLAVAWDFTKWLITQNKTPRLMQGGRLNECWFWQLGLSVYREIWRHSALVQSSLHTLAKLSSLVEVAVRPSATASDPLRTSDLAFQRHQSRIASFRSSVLGYSWCYLFVAISGGWGPVGAVYFWAGWPVRRLCDALGFQQLVSFDHSGHRPSSLRCSGGTLPLLHKSCDSDDDDC